MAVKRKKKEPVIEIKMSGLSNAKYNVKKQDRYFFANKLPKEYRFKSYRIGGEGISVSFLGRFKFGNKDDYVLLAKALGFRSASGGIDAYTSVLVVDDINRTNSVTIDKAREKGILILTEDEFATLAFNKAKETGVINEKD